MYCKGNFKFETFPKLRYSITLQKLKVLPGSFTAK